jgi:hypothetical protein
MEKEKNVQQCHIFLFFFITPGLNAVFMITIHIYIIGKWMNLHAIHIQDIKLFLFYSFFRLNDYLCLRFRPM